MRFMTVGPLDSTITSDAIIATARARGEPTFLPIDVSEAIASRHPVYESEEIPGSAFTSSPARPDDKVETVSVNHLIVAPKIAVRNHGRHADPATFRRQALAYKGYPSAARIAKPDTDKVPPLPRTPAPPPISTAPSEHFWTNTAITFGARVLFRFWGSATAGVRHYIKRDERRLNTLHREKLVAAIAQVRKIEIARRARCLAIRGRRHPARDP